MSRRRAATGLSGILLLDKPAGPTSHDVVDRVRRASGERRVGHAGTLDPMATGLLVVLVGPATRLASYLTAADKTYEATVRFGTATDTDDADGATISEADVPAEVFDAGVATRLLAGLLGESLQRPPAYSAIKVDGRVSHRVARSGEALELEARPIHVSEATLLALDAEAGEWTVRFTVSKGTYVRALARDLGEAAGSAAHLTALRRTASGALSVTDAHPLEVAIAAGGPDAIAELFTAPDRVFSDLPRVEANAADVLAGRPLSLPVELGGVDERLVAVFVDGDRLGALYRRGDARLVPEVVMATPVAAGASR